MATFGAPSVAAVGVTTVRQSTGQIASSASTDVVVNFPVTLPSTAYTATVMVNDSSGSLRVLRAHTKTTVGITVTVQNLGLMAASGVLDVVVIPD